MNTGNGSPRDIEHDSQAAKYSQANVGERRHPKALNPRRPNPARVHNYLLRGKDNYAADRALGEQLLELQPTIRLAVRENRKFVARAVKLVLDRGVRQFIDVGPGLPNGATVHQLARQHASDTRVVYLDNDPVVVVHGRAMLANDDGVAVLHGDVRSPEELLTDEELREHLDFRSPVALLLTCVLDYVADIDDPCSIVTTFTETLASGSAVIISHGTADIDPVSAAVARVHSDGCGCLVTPRSRGEIARFFSGLDLVNPGLVPTTYWRPEGPPLPPTLALGYGGVGIRRD